ncbi:monooxygenase [Xylographa pallens]|nr:monooxygenase [Xylographa pallens]
MSDTDNYDVVVIGAGQLKLNNFLKLGISGIYAAKFYLDIHPQAQLVILDKDSCVGGTWNSRRSYDSFWTQWTVGTAEFSDAPMSRPPEEDMYYEFSKAKHTTKYLEGYVDQQKRAGTTALVTALACSHTTLDSIKRQTAIAASGAKVSSLYGRLIEHGAELANATNSGHEIGGEEAW